jgi:hypothetical protein
MKKAKEFDCVEMKRELQEKRRQRYEGLSDEEIMTSTAEYLETSDDPLAQKWRRLKDYVAPARQGSHK